MLGARIGIPYAGNSGGFDPRNYSDLAAYYDFTDIASLRYNGSNQIALASDKSGNSGVNCLVLNGAAGNYVSAPDAAFATTQLEVVANLAAANWALGTGQIIAAKHASVSQRSFYFGVSATTGTLFAGISSDGSAITTAVSTVALTATNLAPIWVKFTWVSATGIVQFFTSADNVTWNQLGANVTSIQTGNSIFDSTSPFEVGAYLGGTALMFTGTVRRVIIRLTVGGADYLDFNFPAAAKLAPSYTCATGQTVTINTSGDLGARIAGERDLFNNTDANKPVLTIGGLSYATFDGVSDYLKAPAFSLSQPETVYFVGQQVTWTDLDQIYDGNSNFGTYLRQLTATPQLTIGSGTALAIGGNLPVGANGIVSCVYNGASSLGRVNRLAGTSGNAGTNNAGGFCLGSRADALAGFSNIRAYAVLIYSAAHTTAEQDNIIAGLGARYNIAV